MNNTHKTQHEYWLGLIGSITPEMLKAWENKNIKGASLVHMAHRWDTFSASYVMGDRFAILGFLSVAIVCFIALALAAVDNTKSSYTMFSFLAALCFWLFVIIRRGIEKKRFLATLEMGKIEPMFTRFQFAILSISPQGWNPDLPTLQTPGSVQIRLVALARNILAQEDEVNRMRLNLNCSNELVSNAFKELDFNQRRFKDAWKIAGEFGLTGHAFGKGHIFNLARRELSKLKDSK